MSYVTGDYYASVFHGEPVEEADFPSLLLRAEEIVEEMTMYRLTEEFFSSIPEPVQERIRKAVCAQIEYLDANGGSDVDNGAELQSAGLGKFSYTRASGTAGGTGQATYAPRALRLLAPTGLLYRGGGCCNASHT